MKESRHSKVITKVMMMVAFALLSLATFSSLKAQPTNYCTTYPPSDAAFTYYYCYSYFGEITRVTMTEVGSGTVVLDRNSGTTQENCFTWTGVGANVKLGKQYTVSVTAYASSYYYEYIRLFVDWNHNGSFADAGDYIGITAGTYSPNFSGSWTINIPCSLDAATRMRVIAEYYYGPTNGANACAVGYAQYPPYLYHYGSVEDYALIPQFDLQSMVPASGAILLADGTEYDGSSPTRPNPGVTFGSKQPAGTYMTYAISGPKPSTTVVYQGLDFTSGLPQIDVGGATGFTIPKATGPNAINYTSPTNHASVKFTRGGEYRLAISVSGSGCSGEQYSSFTAAHNNDLSVTGTVSPKNNAAPSYFKYLRGQTIKVTGVFQNVGLNDVTEFMGYAFILDSRGDTVYRGSYHFDSYNNTADAIMKPADKREIDFPTVKFNNVGVYRLYFRCNLMSAIDDEAYNDVVPRSDDPTYNFEISYEIQLQANRIMRPAQGATLVGNRPLIPQGEFKNVGVGDASDIPSKFNVYKLPRTGQGPVYQSSKIVQDVPAGKYNLKVEEFDVMTLKETGSYEAEMIISHPDDVVRTDDTTRVQFYVDGGLSGTYTVGTTYGGGSRNYPTIDSLMNALYYRGLAGPTTIELTDATYDVKGARGDLPAWDFSSYIINLGWDADNNRYNTLTFKPSTARSLSKGSVTINLYAPNGKGIVFGQSMTPSNPYSVFTQYSSYGSLAKKYANSPGYIIFDGGSQKALKFKLYSYSGAHGAAFYLQRGSSNITLQNLLIENATPSLTQNVWLPMTSYNPVNGFGFQGDTLVSGPSVFGYSAGIVSRATLMGDFAARLRIDTLPNKNNLIKNNEISGFGYGLMSLGYGAFLMEATGEYQRFHNASNEYNSNTIFNCTRAGMYLGYEENSKVTGNKIFSIGNNNMAAAGIIAGGDMSTNFKGYNNVNVTFDGNEVSGVNSSVEATGIKVKQARNVYPHPTKTQVFFPDVNEQMTLTNNVVWGLTTNNGAAERYGIHLFTERTLAGGTSWNTLKTPFYADYMTRNDRIANNTILMGNNGGLISTGACAAIAAQQAKGVYLRNNAIALTDIGVDASAPLYSAIFYQGFMPNKGGINSDRNVYWVGTNVLGGFARVIEVDEKYANIDEFDRDAFKTLTQWRAWLKQDASSVLGDFTGDLSFTGAEPNQKLRVTTIPQTPLGSFLNNRGEILSWVTKDIDGNTRGQAGQRYDVGASEFTGRMYLTDVEMLNITAPSAYKANIGTYADAEYIMTTSPVNVKANVRNNGNILQAGIQVQVNIFREQPNGTYSTTPEVTKNVLIDIPTTETVEANFMLNQVGGFVPKTYGDLRGKGYIIPDQFVSMEANVTPKYKIVVGLGSDQQNNNNIAQKVVRFYIQKSTMRILLSAENSMITLDANSTANQIAGRLNYDTLRKGMKNLGWVVNIDSSVYSYDIFDRNGWEPRAVNYRDYRTVVWSDGNDKPLSRLERMDVRNFVDMGNEIEKKNIIIGSQEYVRENSKAGTNQDLDFVNNVLRAVTKTPENPQGANGSNDGKQVVGMALERLLVENIKKTAYAADVVPYCGLMGVSSTGEGLAVPAYYYKTRAVGVNDSIMGVATSTLNRNVVLLGVDWRHFGNISMIIRAFVDYAEKNGGTIIPVELVDFNAVAAGNRVDVNWATSSEYNSDRFEVERATIGQAGKSGFNKIAEVKAAGTSSFEIKYGPVVDNNVEFGSKYAYRLKMVDRTGQWKYSNEVEVAIDGSDNWLGIISPNPVTSSEAKFDYSVATESNVVIALYDLSGKKVADVVDGSKAGKNTATINTGNLVNGIYTIVMNVNGLSYTRQLNIAR